MKDEATLTEMEIQGLLRRFAAPLGDYASTSPARKDGAEFMVRTLWRAMIAGPEMEEETWKAFREIGGIPEDDLKAIQDCYYQKMRPVVSDEQLVALQRRYGLTTGDFKLQYLRADEDGDLHLKSEPCPFLDEDSRCTIYEVRPRDCAEYPHTQKKGFATRTHLHAGNTLTCPAVFYVVEEMRARRGGR